MQTSKLSQRVSLNFESLSHVVGDTPAMWLECLVGEVPVTVVAKYEALNFSGSLKDRMVLAMLEDAWNQGRVGGGSELVEVTSGNTGLALAAIGQALGHRVRIYMPDWMSQERLQLIRALGATVVSVSKEQGGFLGSIEMADRYVAANAGAVRLDQFSDVAGIRAHLEGTGRELVLQLQAAGACPWAFVAGVGTGGTVMGVGAALREAFREVRVHPLEPANSPTLRTGKKLGEHRIQGISDEFVPALVDLDSLDGIVDVDDGDAIRMAQRLAAELGMGLGISSGANLLGALSLGVQGGPGTVVATVFPDCNKKYLSTALCREEPRKPEHMTDRVRFGEVRVLPRVGRVANG